MRDGSHESVARRIAVNIVDNSDNSSPTDTPLVQSPDSVRDPWVSNADNQSNVNTPTPLLENVNPISEKETFVPMLSPQQPSVNEVPDVIISNTPIPANDDKSVEDSSMDDDEEALLAELEAERLAEEKARQKRRGLEERLTHAREKKWQNSASLIPERGGVGRSVTNPVQDSTSRL